MDNKDTVGNTLQPYTQCLGFISFGRFSLHIWWYLFFAGDFYKMPITVAFSIASVVCNCPIERGKLNNRIEQFCRGSQFKHFIDGADFYSCRLWPKQPKQWAPSMLP